MSYNFIDKFLIYIYKRLQVMPLIQSGQLKRIYLNIDQDGEFPCIYISAEKVKDISRNDSQMFEFEFDVNIYVKERSKLLLTQIAADVKLTLAKDNEYFDHYEIIGMANSDVSFASAKDLLSNAVCLKYKALIASRSEL